MDMWILRFPEPREKIGDSRNLLVLQRREDGDILELETLEIQGRNMNLPQVVEDQVAKGRPRLVLDLINEKRLDSNDLAQIIGASRYAQDAGGELVFANPSARVREIFRLAHLYDVMAIYDSIGAAADHFSGTE